MGAEAPDGGAERERTATVASGYPSRERLGVGISLLSQDSAQFTGTATYVRSLVQGLSKSEQQLAVELLCNEHSFAAYAGEHRAVSVRRARGFRVGASPYARRVALVAAQAAPAALSRQFSHGLRVVHFPLTLMVPSVRLPTVTTVHDLLHHDMPQYFSRTERLWRRHFYDAAARRATLVIADSEHGRSRIIDALDVSPDRAVTINMAVDHERFRPEPGMDDEAIAADLGLPARYVFYPASLWAHKNHAPLIDAVARTGDDSLHLILSGASFGRLEEIMAYAAARGLDGQVRHLGTVADAALPVIYRRARALVFPSEYEGFGLPPLEAMACGCPVASSRAASLAEVCGDAAIALEPDDPEQMSTVILSVVDDEKQRKRLRARGVERASQFSWASAAEAHVAAFHRAAEIGD